jgi:muramoyltetrapeptide carboxypeptidase
MPRARPLQPDRWIEVIAPASSFDRENFDVSVHVLQEQGLRLRFRDDVFSRERFLAGSDERRLAELLAALDAPDSDVLWCVRGGYGATRLLNDLPLSRIRNAGKLLIGFSDITALHARWLAAGVPSIHGNMVARFAREPADVAARLLGMLSPGALAPSLTGTPLRSGVVTGIVAGGNLALLAALCGTPFQPDFTGAIVLLEDIGERSFRLDRMFIQCEQAGLFRGIAGLACGEFLDCGEKDSPVAQLLAEHAGRIGVPAVAELPFGHGAVNNAIPMGVLAKLDATAGRIEFLEPLT